MENNEQVHPSIQEGFKNAQARLTALEHESLDFHCKLNAVINVLTKGKTVTVEELGQAIGDIQIQMVNARERIWTEKGFSHIKGADELIAKGDVVVFAFDSTIDGEPFDGCNVFADLIILGQNRHLPDLERQIIGLSALPGLHELKIQIGPGLISDMKLEIIRVRSFPPVGKDEKKPNLEVVS